MRPEYILLISILTATCLMVDFILLKIYFIEPFMKLREAEHHSLFMRSLKQLNEIAEERSNIFKEMKSIEEVLKKYSNIVCYMPSKDYGQLKENLEELKNKFMSLLNKYEELDSKYNKASSELKQMRIDEKIKYN